MTENPDVMAPKNSLHKNTHMQAKEHMPFAEDSGTSSRVQSSLSDRVGRFIGLAGRKFISCLSTLTRTTML